MADTRMMPLRAGRRRAWACALGAALAVPWLVAAPARAQQLPPDLTAKTLDDLMKVTITTASRASEDLADAPALVEVVSAKNIRDRGYRSLADVLKDRVRFQVDLSGDQDYPTQLTVQGTRGANRVIVMLDGVRISPPTREPLPILANYPVHNARQIEIVYGPGSALYGADAFSAVINIISQDVPDAEGLTVNSSVGQFGLRNYSGSFGAYIGERGRLMVAGQYVGDAQPDMNRYYPADFNGMQAQRSGVFNTIFGPMTPRRPVPPDYSAPIAAHSLQAIYRNGGLQLSLFQNRSRVPTSPAYTPDNAVYSDAAFHDNRLIVAAGGYTRARGNVTSVSTLTFSRHELAPESGYFNVFSNLTKSYKYAYGAMVKGEEQVSWDRSPRTRVTFGGTFEYFDAIPQGADLNAPIESRSTPGTILDTNIVDAFVRLRYSNTGAFVQLRQRLNSRLTTTLGVRADYNSRYGGTVNPRLGLVAKPRTGTTAKVLVGTAFLAPSPYNAYGHYGAFYSLDGGTTYASDFWHVPYADLEPERKTTVEASVRQALGPSLTVSGSAFRTQIRNLIQEADTDPNNGGLYLGWPVADLDHATNAGHQRTFGGTVELDFLKTWGPDRRLSAYTGVSVADGHVSDSGAAGDEVPVGAMVPVQLRAGSDVDWGRWTTSVRMATLGRQRLLATTVEDGQTVRRTLAGYTTVDLSLRRRAVFRNLDLFVTIDNALDARYRHINARAYTNPEELIGAPQVPRRITFGFDLRVR